MTSAKNHIYMLAHREINQGEIERLDRQHDLLVRAMFDGQLVHKTVPMSDIKDVADVGVGTGIRLLVHDATTSSPTEFRQKFDLVNVRLMNHALLEESLPKVVENIANIIRPGGYLQWQESEFWDVFAIPSSTAVEECVMEVNEERKARGFIRFLPPYLLKTILSLKIPESEVNPLSKPPSEDVFRIRTWKTKPVAAAPLARKLTEQLDNDIQALILEGIVNLLDSARLRMEDLAAEESKPNMKTELYGRIETVQVKRAALVADIEKGNCKFASYMTWVVAQKRP